MNFQEALDVGFCMTSDVEWFRSPLSPREAERAERLARSIQEEEKASRLQREPLVDFSHRKVQRPAAIEDAERNEPNK